MRPSLLLAVFALLGTARADVVLAPLFQDHAVLQRDKPVPLWGTADAGEAVTVSFAGQVVGTKARADGNWIVLLSPMTASSTPQELVVQGKNKLALQDILIGEVWLCSGQSNMEWPVAMSDRGPEEAAAAQYPLIRHFKVARTVADQATGTVAGGWQVCSPQTAGSFTAVGYFFARDLMRKLNVPIGLVNSTWGGTPIEAWMSPAALARNSAFNVVGERWRQALAAYPENKARYDAELEAWKAEEAAAKAANRPPARRQPGAPQGPGHPNTPSGLFNGMINPLLPYALRGVLWYQGESNAGRASEYRALFTSLITSWRGHFGQGDIPFYWVQLANFKTDRPDSLDWPRLREAQSAALELPETGQAVTIDIGNPDDIHPRNKQEVGRRLALIAKANVYDIPGDYSGPAFIGAEPEGSALRLRFDFATPGIIARNKPLQSFEVAGEDRRFYPAKAVIDGDTLLVSAPEVKQPVAVRYAWRNSPETNFYNGAGLPAAPFRSDTW